MIDFFNLGTNWIMTEILSHIHDVSARVQTIEKSIHLMSTLFRLNNFQGTLMVLSALAHR